MNKHAHIGAVPVPLELNLCIGLEDRVKSCTQGRSRNSSRSTVAVTGRACLGDRRLGSTGRSA